MMRKRAILGLRSGDLPVDLADAVPAALAVADLAGSQLSPSRTMGQLSSFAQSEKLR